MEKSRGNLSKFRAFENRRKFPRLKTNLPVIITGLEGKKFKSLLYDISPDGVQIRYAVKDGINMFPRKENSIEGIKSLKCTLQFDLAIYEQVSNICIDAYPVYLRTVSENTMAAGMLFSKENLSENKKISDFLFYQLQEAYTDVEFVQKDIKDSGNDLKPPVTGPEIESNNQSGETGDEKLIPEELERLIVNANYPKEHTELIKQLLYRVLGSLKVILETTRHIDERIHIMEHKISRKG